jgi:hypothetical protein
VPRGAFQYADADRGTLTLAWPLTERRVRESIQRDPEWQPVLRRFSDLTRVAACEVIDLVTGATLGRVPVDMRTPSRWFRNVAVTKDRLFLQDGGGRVLVYGFDGVVKRRVFAGTVTPSLDGRRLAFGTAPGRLVVLDEATSTRVAEMQFASPVLLSAFSADARTLWVLTADQTVYAFALKG